MTYSDANFAASTLTADDVNPNMTGTASGNVGVSGSGTTRTVTISGITGNGTLGIALDRGHGLRFGGKHGNWSKAKYHIPVDNTAPTVTINQAAGQADPTMNSPINFTVVFSKAVTDFATGDVTLSGTAGATTAVVTGSGTTYNVAVSGMTGSGTVIADIAAGKAHDSAGNANAASGQYGQHRRL